MPDIEEQLRDRMEALTQAQERQGTAEDRIQRLECQLVRLFWKRFHVDFTFKLFRLNILSTVLRYCVIWKAI